MNPASEILAHLDASNARANAATCGPWHTETEDETGEFGSGPDTMSGYKGFFVENSWGKRICDSQNGEHSIEVEYGDDSETWGIAWDDTGKKNLTFIAAARTELPRANEAIAELVKLANSVVEIEPNKHDKRCACIHCSARDTLTRTIAILTGE